MTSIDHARVRELFEAACDLPSGERSAFLETACAGDPALRDEVRSLLEYDTDGDDALSDTAIDRGESLGFIAGDEQGLLPERFGDYRIIRLIGTGGMGEVYEAEQDSPRRRVALKIMHAGAASAQMKRRFHQESEIQGLLRHPGIAQVYETGVGTVHGRQVPYFAMELVDGLPLTDYADSHELGTDARLRLLIDVCDAVGSAHGKGVIHRDLKPDNILVEESEGGPRVKVLDFGVAKLTERDVHFTTMRTEIGQVIGTLSYMSPEQIGGETDRLDTRTDVHALGAVLYELLTGERPFDLAGRPIAEAARIVREEDPSSISRFDRAFRGDVETIIGRAMEKDPERRYPSASALADDLRRVLNNKPIEARPPSAMYQLSKFTRRNKALVGGVAATVVALLIGLVFATWFALDAAEGRRLARWQTYRTAMTAASGSFALNKPETAVRLLDEAPEEHRGWAHQHLSNRLDSWVYSFGTGDLACVAADHGAGHIIGLRRDGSLTIWDADTGGAVGESDIGQPITAASAVAVDGELIVLTEGGEILRVAAESGRVVARYAAGENGWNSVGLCADGSRLFAENSSVVVVWESADGSEVVRHHPRPNRPTIQVRDVEIGPFGLRLAVTWADRDIATSHVLDLENGEIYPTGSSERPVGTDFSRDGGTLAVRMTVRNIHVHQTDPPRQTAVLEGHSGVVSDAVFLDDGRLVSISEGVVHIRARGRDAPVGSLMLAGWKGQTLLTPGGSLLVTFDGRAGRALLWDLDRADADVFEHDRYVYNIAWSPDSRLLATHEFSARMTRIWDVDRGAVLAVVDIPVSATAPFAFSRDGRSLLLTRRNGNRAKGHCIVETAGWTMTHEDVDPDEIPALLGGTRSLRLAPQHVYSPDGRTLLRRIRQRAGKRVWTLNRSGERHELPGAFSGSREAVWHPDGRWFAVTTRGDPPGIAICDGHTGETLTEVAQPATVFTVDIHPDGSRLVTGSEDGVVRVYDTERFGLITELNGHTSYVFVARFSPDGTRLATGSGDKSVRIWDTVLRSVRRSGDGP